MSVSMVCAKVSGVSPVKPAMTSMLISRKPACRASSKARSTSAAACFLPIAASTLSSMDCGLMLTRPTPAFFSTRSFSGVMVSGRPASTVYSAQRRQVEAVRERSGQPFELLRGQRRRRTAADVDALHALSGLPDERRRLAYLTAQRSEIRLDKRARLRSRRGKRTNSSSSATGRTGYRHRAKYRPGRSPYPAPSRSRPRGW